MKLLTQEGAIAGTRSEDLTNKFSTLHWFIKSGGVRTREYDFKSFIKRIVSGSTLGRLHNTMGIYIHGSGHKLSMWYHVVLGHSAESLLVLITLRGRRFEPFARRQRIYLSFGKGDHHGKGRGDLHYVDANGTNTTTEQSPTVICGVRMWRHATTGTTGTSVST